MNRRHTWLSGAASATAVAALVVAPAHAAPQQAARATTTAPTTVPGPVDCPTALPTTEAVDGVTGTGYTVERGTTAEPFTATVLGRLHDGIAPGIDMIMAELDSPAVRRAGVWGGMSGSPVYAADGRLIGSVSYGLAGSSPIAGITPAAALGTLLDGDPDGPAALRGRRTTPVKPDSRSVRRLARTGEVSAAEASQGFRQLQVPVQVSGAASPGAKKFMTRLQAKSGVQVRAGGSAAPVTSTTPAPALTGGGNFAATLAYGDATFGGVGTTTYTCKGSAVAFGHPFVGFGVTSQAAHSATAVYVQPDPVWGAFKVANIGPVVGKVDRDRTEGLRARIGTAPVAATITSTLKRVEGGAERTGTTKVVEPSFTPDAAAFHSLFNVDKVLGSTSSVGTARVNLSVRGKRADGKVFALSLGNTFTDTDRMDPINFQVGNWVYEALIALTDQPFEKISIHAVNLTGSISSKAAVLRPTAVQYYTGKKWVSTSSGVQAGADRPLSGRVSLLEVRGTTKATAGTVLTPPVWMRGRDMYYSVETGSGASEEAALPEPTSFPVLLNQLRAAPRTDEVRVSILHGDGRVALRTKVRATHTVTDFAADYDLVVR